jgi:uncharacterized membrane protein
MTMPATTKGEAAKPAGNRRRASYVCEVCKKSFARENVLPGSLVRENLSKHILARVPTWSDASFICHPCLNGFRLEYVRGEMEEDRGALGELEKEVLDSIKEGELLSENVDATFEETRTLGERTADAVAAFGGSWRFIIIFFAVMAVWIVVNSLLLLWRPFDPYPYILLNLVLSLLAAVQAPIIMMSQNRQEARDRLRGENDYKVNLRAEVEIRAISEKVDQLIHQHWAHLLEVQEIEMEMIRDLAGGVASQARVKKDRS